MSKEKHELSLEEQAELEKSRTISDAKLLEDEEIGLRPGEKFDDYPNAKSHGWGGRHGLFVVEKGGKYVIEKEGKRLEVNERQIAKARHEMLRSLGHDALRNENLARIGLESTEGLPQYDLLDSVPAEKKTIEDRAICCVLDSALGSDAEIGRFSDKEVINKVLNIFYEAHPELNNSEKPFLLEGDFGTVVVRGDKIEFLP